MKRTTYDYIRIGLIVVCVIAICAIAYLIQQNGEHFLRQSEENQKTIQAIQKEIDEIAVIDTTDAMVKESKVKLNSARTLGNRIAELQNQYADRVRNQLKEPGDEDAYYAELDKISAELDTYFGEGSTFRGSWYLGDFLNRDWEWKFCTNYHFSNDAANVLWTCTSDDQLLVYVTGTYHADTHRIEGLQKRVTTVATSSYGVTQSEESMNQNKEVFDEEAYGKAILEMAEDIRADGEIVVPERTPQEQAEYEEKIGAVKKAQAELRERMTGGD